MDAVIEHMDATRRVLLRLVMRFNSLRCIFIRPDLRIPIAATASVLVSAVISLVAPATVLLAGAAVLGLPHVLAGLRHVGIRRTMSPPALVFSGLAFAAGLSSLMGGPGGTRVMIVLFAGAIASETLAVPTRLWMKGLCLAL